MALPNGWPPRPASNTRTHRIYLEGAATANFSDNAYLWTGITGANMISPTPYVPPGSTAAVSFGDLTASGSPMGGGRNANDVNSSTGDATKQADPVPQIWSFSIIVRNDGVGDLQVSFDGVNVHDRLKAGEVGTYQRRHEAGISVRGVGGTTPSWRITAW